ncbi:MAG TPA: hypothetical protein DEB31_09525 [Clostridiales bacterium]|nr:hypothetical protein [Clostridiales bacterium]
MAGRREPHSTEDRQQKQYPPEKQKKKVSHFGQLKILIVVGVLIYSGVTFANLQSTFTGRMDRLAEKNREIAEYERERDYLLNERDYVQTDESIEQQARIQFGWLYENEVLYVEGQGGASAQPTESPSEPIAEESPTPEEQTPSVPAAE